jgi:hypothetical protein
MANEFIRLNAKLGSWNNFVEDWKQQCASLDEDFSTYELEPIGVVRDLAEGVCRSDAAAYALHDGSIFAAMCQINLTPLPGYNGDVLRVRMLYLSPHYEYGEYSLDDYSKLIIDIFYNIIKLSNGAMPSRHIKFHLRSPADRQFFATFGNALDAAGVFASVAIHGAWLYITKN